MKTNFVKHTAAAFAALALFSTALPITAFAAEPVNDCIDENETAYEGTITIESPDVINNVDEFDVFGTVSFTDEAAPSVSHMFLEIVNKDPEKPYIYEIQLVEPLTDGEYRFPSIQIPSGYADDVYLIRVYAIGTEDVVLLLYAEKEVTLINQ